MLPRAALRAGDPGYAVQCLLAWNVGHLSDAQFAEVIGTLDQDRAGQEVLACRTGKEKLRDALNPRARITRSAPCERNARDRLFRCCGWCARHDDIPGLLTLARIVTRRESENGGPRSHRRQQCQERALNRIARPGARQARGFRNPASQRRRVKTARTRGPRRPPRVYSSAGALVL